MKANKFVKEYGWEYAKHILNEDSVILVDLDYAHLKRLIESYELVEKYNNKHGGIRFLIRWCMYRYGNTQQFNDHLKQAIADVESCK